MCDRRPHAVLPVCVLLALALAAAPRAAATPPADSLVAPSDADSQLVLISPLDGATTLHPGGYRVDNPRYHPADLADVKFGREALTLSVGAQGGGSKGHFSPDVRKDVQITHVGCWFHIAPGGANVQNVGFQIYDKGGEAFIYLREVDWTGWQWVETPVDAASLKHAYPQKDADGQVDLPLGGVHLVWFCKDGGPSEVTVDGFFAKARAVAGAPQAVTLSIAAAADLTLQSKAGGSIFVTNPTPRQQIIDVALSLQSDPSHHDAPLPDPVLGSDHATAGRSWTMSGDSKLDENTLTDGVDYTAAATPWGQGGTETFQFVELDQRRTIIAMGWLSGDANWVHFADVAASLDGKTFTAVPQLQNVEMLKKWGRQMFPDAAPFDAKVIRLRYHNHGEKEQVIRMPSALMIYDGADDETFAVPQVGPVVAEQRVSVTVAPRGVAAAAFDFDQPLKPGAYLLGALSKIDGLTRVDVQHLFVEPAPVDNGGLDNRFGLNASRSGLAAEHRKLGIGWVRFENFKWPMVSPAAHEYAYDGSVKPWVVNVDQIIRDYTDAGLHVIPMMFLTPEWASQPDAGVEKKIIHALPPKDNADFGEFAFQSVARFGSRKLSASDLKTADKVSGLNLIKVFELGNEPNLNPKVGDKLPGWGAWAGTMDQWWEAFRAGVKGIRDADPDAIVSSPGFAGCTVERIDSIRTYTYADGSHPIDLVDLINVHYYSGRTPPEIATNDANTASATGVTFEEHLERLCEWRDRHRPGAPIWMTETGYDTAGPIGTNEHLQAARLPRVVMLCLAGGLDKVIVYRESGSTAAQHAAAGVLRNDMTRKPSWYTYATMIRQIADATPGSRLPAKDDNVRLQTWTRGGKMLLVAYTTTKSGTLDLELGGATVTDAFGSVRRVSSTRGLTLTEFPQYLSDIADESALRPLIAQAQGDAAARKAARAKEAARNYCLFNFGQGPEPVGSYLGVMRYYADVPVETAYDAQRGYGFLDAGGAKNGWQHWKARPLERSSAELRPGAAFRFDLEPGTYELSVSSESRKGDSVYVIEGAQGDVTIPVKSDGAEAVRITVRGRQLTLRPSADAKMYWLIARSVD